MDVLGRYPYIEEEKELNMDPSQTNSHLSDVLLWRSSNLTVPV